MPEIAQGDRVAASARFDHDQRLLGKVSRARGFVFLNELWVGCGIWRLEVSLLV